MFHTTMFSNYNRKMRQGSNLSSPRGYSHSYVYTINGKLNLSFIYEFWSHHLSGLRANFLGKLAVFLQE